MPECPLGHCHLQGWEKEAFLHRLYQIAGNTDAVGALDQVSRAYRAVADLAKAEGIPLEEAARLILARGGSPK